MQIKVTSAIPDAQEKYPERKIFSWNVTSLASKNMLIRLEFENPLEISPNFVRF